MRQSLIDIIITWHQRGYTNEETARLLNRNVAEVNAVVKGAERHASETRAYANHVRHEATETINSIKERTQP